jgi:antagonist of KipI
VKVTIIRAGMLTTVQDLGRWGQQASGVPVAGPMDEYSHRLANRLVGNDAAAAALEITLVGPEIQCDADLTCAVAGATFTITAGGAPVPTHAPFALHKGVRLRFGERLAGSRATLAFRGGINVEPVFGSRATSLISRMGALGGRALVAGDVLRIGDQTALERTHAHMPEPWPHAWLTGGARLRVIRGPHENLFTPAAYERLFGSRFQITPNSNRMGYRLDGPALLHHGRADILSDATPLGSLQVPASGQPILLMADRQTTGGYPKIATVISADVPLAGQLVPGDWIEFKPCTREAAVEALRSQRARLDGTHPRR